jgi:hypothetical protein
MAKIRGVTEYNNNNAKDAKLLYKTQRKVGHSVQPLSEWKVPPPCLENSLSQKGLGWNLTAPSVRHTYSMSGLEDIKIPLASSGMLLFSVSLIFVCCYEICRIIPYCRINHTISIKICRTKSTWCLMWFIILWVDHNHHCGNNTMVKKLPCLISNSIYIRYD